jgi:hypothetical protein
MDAHTFEPHPVIEYLIAPALAVRDGLSTRARAALTRGDDRVPRTRLRADDLAAEPFSMSAHVVGPLAAATLMLDTILTGFEPQDGRFPALTRDYGMFPLIRTGMLHASRAIYLLQPAERADRIARLVALAREDAAIITRAQELMGACTCESSLIGRAADVLGHENELPDSWPATDTVVVSEAACRSTFGPPLLGLYEAIDCAARGLSDPFRSFIRSPLALATPWGEKEFVIEWHEIHWLALAALADLVSIGWHLADLEDDADAAAA